MFAKVWPVVVCLFAVLFVSIQLFLALPGFTTAGLVAMIMTIGFALTIIWVSASNRWLLINILNVPVFEVRKYDLLTLGLLVSSLIAMVSNLDFFVELVTSANDPTVSWRKDFFVNEENSYIFDFNNLIFLTSYILLSVFAATALIKAERRLNIFNSTIVGALASYWCCFVSASFPQKRYRLLLERQRVLLESQTQ